MTRKNIELILIITIVIVFVSSIICYHYFANQKIEFENSSTPQLSVTFFDVGQGDSALIVTPNNYQILVDGGPDNTIAAKLGAALPFFDRDLDLVILSHPHADHVSGLAEVLNRYKIKKIIMTGVVHTAPDYLDFLKLIKDKKIPVQIIDRPQDWSPEAGMSLSFLWPRESLAEKKIDSLNNSSIAFKLIYASTSFLFTGDLEDEEALSSTTEAQLLKSDVLKVGHHGSTNANSALFLQLVLPQYAVISVAADNDYGHPHYRTIYELQKIDARILRTDQEGNITIYSNGKNVWLRK